MEPVPMPMQSIDSPAIIQELPAPIIPSEMK